MVFLKTELISHRVFLRLVLANDLGMLNSVGNRQKPSPKALSRFARLRITLSKVHVRKDEFQMIGFVFLLFLIAGYTLVLIFTMRYVRRLKKDSTASKFIAKILALMIAIGIITTVVIGIRFCDHGLQVRNQRYMYWRFYSGSKYDRLAMIDAVMMKSSDRDLDKLNDFLINDIEWAAFSRAAGIAAHYASQGDYRYLPFITNTILRQDIEYARRKYMIDRTFSYHLTNSHLSGVNASISATPAF